MTIKEIHHHLADKCLLGLVVGCQASMVKPGKQVAGGAKKLVI